MRKALLSLLLILVIILMVLVMKNGFAIGSFQVYGFESISKKNEELTESIADTNAQNDNYTSAFSKLKSDVEELAVAKKNYLDAISQNSESDIRHATQTKTYTIEYLWSRIGNYATSQGINLEMELTNSTLQNPDYKNLNFKAQGEYLAIVQFMYDLENDSDLDFLIDNFHMTQSNASFVVKDVKIQREQTTGAVNEDLVDEETEESKESDTSTDDSDTSTEETEKTSEEKDSKSDDSNTTND